MTYKFYKTVKIKSGRPRCPYREMAVRMSVPRYVDKNGVARMTASGNKIEGRKEQQRTEARIRGVQPRKPKASLEVISAKNVAHVKKWREQNPDKNKALRSSENFMRRSAVRGRVMEKIGAQFLKEQRDRQNDLCAYCGTDLNGSGHQDHVIPVAKGGAHVRINIVWACELCNLRKGAKLGWVPFWGGR
jgi:hypothetical protein